MKLRAIYIGDVQFNECRVFEFPRGSRYFEMIVDPDFRYADYAVLEDPHFLIFKVYDKGKVKQISKTCVAHLIDDLIMGVCK